MQLKVNRLLVKKGKISCAGGVNLLERVLMSEITTLSNGLRIASYFMPSIDSVAISISVEAGSRYETANQNGLSHFLEHMAFKGTKRRSAKQIAEEFDAIGGHLNAYTGREHTVYYAKVLKENFSFAMDILSDILQYSVFNPEEMTKEKQVILQEIAQTNDTPDDIVFDFHQETLFPNQPLGRSILGPAEHVKSFSQHDVQAYMQSLYATPSMVVSVAGNIAHDEVVNVAEDFFRHLPTSRDIQKQALDYRGGDCRKTQDLEQTHLLMSVKGLGYHDPHYYTMQVLSSVLGEGMSSRLFQEIREKRGLVYHVQSYTSLYCDGGVFGVYAAASEEHLPTLVPVLCEELVKTVDTIQEVELERVKAQVKANVLMSKESCSGLSDLIGKQHLCFKRHIPLEETLAQYNAVTVEDVQALARTLLTGSKLTVTALGKIDKLEPYEKICERVVI